MRGDIIDPIRLGRFWQWPDGKTLPVVSGGSDDGTSGGTGNPPPPPAKDEDKDKPKTFTQDDLNRVLADDRRKHAERYADHDDLKAKAAKLDEIEAANASETEKAIAKATKEATDIATKAERAKADARIVRAEVKALAGTKLEDPTDAVRLIDLSAFKVDDDGNVDEDAIRKAIDDLLKTKPYLAANAAKGNGKMPNLGQGDRGKDNAAPSVETGRSLYAERHAKRGGTKTT